ncbi:MAG: ABC-type spermidine/putrescine transport system permease protein [Candidatus Phytoplasma cynodontis]|uniref:ABC transporter permease n=1 Tax='Cynodon dactylon' phytoplasma TaxID=295320 RepID=UPI001265B8A2|nr:ABC transporter permease subunit ['Cynodon dactylon' phytoplasma]KAB8121864.1 ABC transporter permease subunit ['Cynodon dactylon' phytoplasma]WIA07811.1 MAG: ABC-type spermidine/putrescine transport system permease protein [Candidatus Phytoplasma cynodontis]
MILFRKEKNNKFNNFLFLPYFIIFLFLVLIPIIIIFFDSIQKYNNKNLFKVILTFEYYKNFYTNTTFIYVLLRSMSVSIIATFFIIIFAYPLAYIISRMNILAQSILILLINGTIWINMILKTQALVQIFSLIEKKFHIVILESNTAMFIGFIYLFFPYMFLSIYISISKIDSNLIDAAKDLGANEKQIFKNIIFPLALPGLITGTALVILQIVTNIVVPKYLGPTTVIVISELIENKVFLNGDIKSACAIAINLSFLMFCILLFFRKEQYNIGEINEKKNK